MDRKDYFSIFELYYLLDAFDGQLLMGLPSRQELTISSKEIWESAKNDLGEKGFVTPNGELTPGGFIVTETLKEYCTGSSLLIINNVYIMRGEDETSSVVIVDNQIGYQLFKISRIQLLIFLQQKISLFAREPKSDEIRFLKEELPMARSLEELFYRDDTIVIQYYPLLEMTQSRDRESLIQQLLVTEAEGDLFVYHVKENTVSRYSQYYFLERLYTYMGIPFREEDFHS